MPDIKFGWKKDPFSYKDFYHETIKAALLPVSVDLSQWIPEIRNQGQVGSCTGFGIGANITATYRQQLGNPEWESPIWIYNLGRAKAGTLKIDSGAYPKDCLDMLLNFGFLKEQYWPYVDVLDTTDPTTAEIRKSKANKFQDFVYYRCVDGVDGIMSALAANHFVSIGTPWFSKWMNIGSDGVLPEVVSTDEIVGGHETYLFGYDQDKKVFYGANSWGTSWGKEGTYVMPFSAINVFKQIYGYDAHYVTFTVPVIPVPEPIPEPPIPVPPIPIPTPEPEPPQCCASIRAGIRAFTRTRKYLKNKNKIQENKMSIDLNKIFSQKFLLALGAIIADIIIGLGYNIDPQNIVIIAGAIASIYAAIQGLVESVKITSETKIKIATMAIELEKSKLNK